MKIRKLTVLFHVHALRTVFEGSVAGGAGRFFKSVRVGGVGAGKSCAGGAGA